MTFNIGEKVRVKSYEEIKETLDRDSLIEYFFQGERRYIYFNSEMITLCGNTYTIKDDSFGRYLIEVGEDKWTLAEAWIEPVKENSYYVSSFDEDAEIVETEETKTVVETLRKEQFIEKILDLEPSIEQCIETDCEECNSFCIVRKMKIIIQSYKENFDE